MKLQPRKPIYAFLILIPLIVLFAFVLFTVRNRRLNERTEQWNAQKNEAIGKTLKSFESGISEAVDHFYTRNKSLIDLMPVLLKELLVNGVYKGPGTFFDENGLDGIVVQLKNNKVIYPETEGPVPEMDAELIRQEVFFHKIKSNNSEQHAKEFFVSSRKISDDYYYVDLTPFDEIYDFALETTQITAALEEIEKSYDAVILLKKHTAADENQHEKAVQTAETDGSQEFFYQYKIFNDDGTPETFGINQDLFTEKPDRLTISGRNYQCFYQEISIFEDVVDVVTLLPLKKEIVNILTSVMLAVMLTLMAAVSMIMWLYWTQVYVRDTALLPEQVPLYHPIRVKEIAVSFGLIGAVVVFLITVCFQLLSNLNIETIDNQDALTNMMERLGEIGNDYSKYKENEEKWNAYFAERIARLISEEPALRTAESLKQISELAGSEYIMHFDSQGKEIISSNDFIGYSINDTDVLKSFQRVLSGLKTLISDPLKDPILEKDIQYIGTRIPIAEEGQKQHYGVFLLAFDAQKTWQAVNENTRIINDFLENSTPERNLVVIIDKNNNKAAFSSDRELRGKMIPDLKYDETDLPESDLNFFSINGKRYYGPYQSDDNYVCYYLTADTYIRVNSFRFSVLSVLGYSVILIFITWFMLDPYTADVYNECIKTRTATEQDAEWKNEQDSSTITDLIRYMERMLEKNKKRFWDEMPPEKKTGYFIRLMLGIIVILIIILQFRMTLDSKRSTISFILTGNWNHGMNLLGWAAALIVVIAFAVFSFLKDILQQIFCSIHDPKIVTIFRLIFSLIQYVAVIFSIYLIFGYLGFNTTMQITSVGILSLAISLGSQSLVADILAGIFIIFEGDFHVGDIIEVNDFSGVVQEIGVRSTKLLGLGDNIKIINNSNIKDVLNMSKLHAWFTLEFRIAPDQPLTEIEAMLRKELPELKKSIPDILKGPFYKGVWEIVSTNFGPKYTLSIVCECDAKKSRMIQRELNHAVIMLFEKYNYKLG